MTFDSDEELSPAERKKVEKVQEKQAKAVARFEKEEKRQHQRS